MLQHAFGWTGSDLHQFHDQDGTRYAMPSPFDDDIGMPTVDERKTLLADVFAREKTAIAYEYDFGDSWIHIVEFEKIVDPETVASLSKELRGGSDARNTRAVLCVDGARNGPPEDCGGVWGYERILELKAVPPDEVAGLDEDDRDLLEWFGNWDAEHYDPALINRAIGRIGVKKAYADW